MPDTAFYAGIHAAPVRAETNPRTGSLSIHFHNVSSYPEFVMYVGDPAIATDLADAINGVLERHRQAAAEAADRAEQLILAPVESVS